MFDHISERLQFLEARCVLKPIPVDSKCDGTLSVVFDILHEKLRWKTSLKSVSTTGQELKSIANKAELNKEFGIRKGMQMPVCTSVTYRLVVRSLHEAYGWALGHNAPKRRFVRYLETLSPVMTLHWSKLTFTSKKVDPKYGHLVTVSATKMKSSFYYRSQNTTLAVHMLESSFLSLSFLLIKEQRSQAQRVRSKSY